MAATPTDLQILQFIYNEYYKSFSSFVKENPTRVTKMYVPIDVDMIGEHFKIDGDIIFGRLYYHLNHKYSYKPDQNVSVDFFANTMRAENGKTDMHCVHFPYLASVLADLKDENKKFWWSAVLAIASLIISVIAIAISFMPS
jgi:hypothetical protein